MVDLKKFIIAILDANSETFIVHVAIYKQEEIKVYSKKRAQI